MKRFVPAAAGVLLFSGQAASAADIGGNVAVSLAALVGEHSPLLFTQRSCLIKTE